MWGMPYALIIFMQNDTSYEHYFDDDEKEYVKQLMADAKAQEIQDAKYDALIKKLKQQQN